MLLVPAINKRQREQGEKCRFEVFQMDHSGQSSTRYLEMLELCRETQLLSPDTPGSAIRPERNFTPDPNVCACDHTVAVISVLSRKNCTALVALIDSYRNMSPFSIALSAILEQRMMERNTWTGRYALCHLLSLLRLSEGDPTAFRCLSLLSPSPMEGFDYLGAMHASKYHR